MTKISKMNTIGTFVTALALAGAFALTGCAAPAGTQNPPVGSIPGASQPYTPPAGVPSQIPSAHQAAVFGNLTGTIVVKDEEGHLLSQAHTISVAPSGQEVTLTYSSGNQHFQAQASVQALTGSYGSAVYLLTSQAQVNPSIYPKAPVLLQIQISVSANGAYESFNSAAGMYEGSQFQSVVKFNSALSKQ